MIDDRMIWSATSSRSREREPRERGRPPTPTGATSATGTSATTVPTVGIRLRRHGREYAVHRAATGDQRLMTRARGEVTPR